MTRGIWDRETVALLLLAAALPLALTWLWFGGVEALARLALVLVVAGAWHVVFMLARAQPPSLAGALTGLAVAMLAPEGLGLFQLVIGISFGTVVAELVFGGWGRNLLNPATVTLAFLGFGFPAVPWPELVVPVGWAAIPMAVLGALLGITSVRIVAGCLVALGGTVLVGLPIDSVLTGAGVVLVLLVCDPVASATTSLGRWLNGLLYGLLVVLFATSWQEAAPIQLAVSAALFASLAAPLLDEIAVTLWLVRRRRRFG
jgi:Na+-transporting NADH:ubiquinone oxidoreductase subunit B